ncbi:sulfurtransferase TusA family protein [Microbaculum marinisediminis]|uniref:Sulfurtransferase TusA family protein n=1 Tax=Microbaculum marinisediminis TaxID=2931392 RepID=A0AAW5QSI4_9HYPH|nr:sulfurtransferase TusA family protein [Microbaculum sp. A6E488]MCT8970920.1 sulfurtransferase TusA family protein [Microbaculum sp. A6E488]
MGLFSRKKSETTGAAPTGQATLSDGSRITIAQSVDCLGDSCPRPQLMTKKAIGQVGSGDVIEIVLDNPSSVEALPPMCDELNAAHLETIQEPRCWKVYIRKD